MNLIPEWRRAWRMLSMIFSGLALAWLGLPAEAQTAIIYSRADAEQAQRAYRLARLYDTPLIDTDIRPGMPWREAMMLAICNSRAVLLIWSARSAASAEVAIELQAAGMCGIPVVPILIDDTPLPSAITLQGIDWR